MLPRVSFLGQDIPALPAVEAEETRERRLSRRVAARRGRKEDRARIDRRIRTALQRHEDPTEEASDAKSQLSRRLIAALGVVALGVLLCALCGVVSLGLGSEGERAAAGVVLVPRTLGRFVLARRKPCNEYNRVYENIYQPVGRCCGSGGARRGVERMMRS